MMMMVVSFTMVMLVMMMVMMVMMMILKWKSSPYVNKQFVYILNCCIFLNMMYCLNI